MIKDTLAKMEAAIEKVKAMEGADAAALAKLLAGLKAELEALPESRMDEARSVAHFTEAAAHEITRSQKSMQLKSLSIAGISYAVKGFEASHPKLVDVANDICMLLSRMGI